MNPDKHKDTFDHFGYKVHPVVSPDDCMACHPVERGQYNDNLMSHAHNNLAKNTVYTDLKENITGIQHYDNGEIKLEPPDMLSDLDACYQCHGSEVSIIGVEKRDTAMGELEFPKLTGWPNQGVGRINPDGSMGACTPCHTRHRFAIETARNPHTCSQCHKGPDVPAYKVYEVSKHGNIFDAHMHSYDMEAVPWVPGDDFTSPSCATCHVSLLASPDGDTIAPRTHQMNDRQGYRILGLIYSHPHTKSADVSNIVNKMGLPLPTELTGEPVSEFLIDESEQQRRMDNMKAVCLSCHTSGWVDNHYERYENTIRRSNAMVLTATQIMLEAWDKGAAKGLADGDSIFNEAIEKMWVEQWLFYANSVRYSSAMAGADLGTFANGRWYMSKNIQDMEDWLKFKLETMDTEDED
jgi:hydroxylamine dehydrogenase